MNLDEPDLKATVEQKEAGVSIVFHGRSDRRDPSEIIKPWSEKLLPSLSGQEVLVDFRGLEYMNSSSFMPIFQLLRSARELATSVHVLYNGEANWQRLSFSSLEAISKAWPNLKVTSSPEP